MTDREAVGLRVERELSAIPDPSLLPVVRTHPVEPHPVERDWNYGHPGQTYLCWTALEHPPSGTGVAYRERGFGPAFPWGLVLLGGPHTSMGTSAAWYGSLGDAVRESCAWEGPNPAESEAPSPERSP